MCPGSSPPSSVPVHKCCETWASRTAPGDLLRWGLGLENGHTTGALAALQDLMWGREGACRSFLTARSQNSPITDPRPSYTPRKLIGDALLRSTKILRQHLSACHLSSCSFCSHLPPRPPQPSASTSFSSLWLQGHMQKGWCCCSAAPGSPGSHSFAVFQTSCCRHRGEPCWQAFFDTCTIQCVSGRRSDLIIRKLRRQREGGKIPGWCAKTYPQSFGFLADRLSAPLQIPYTFSCSPHFHLPTCSERQGGFSSFHGMSQLGSNRPTANRSTLGAC